MTSIAYKQYCNISYNGGSYVCSPIKGPLSTSQTPGTIRNKNRGLTYAKNGQPSKDLNCDSTNTNAIERKMYKHKIFTIQERYDNIKSNYNVENKDSSVRTSLMKTSAIGKSGMNELNQPISFKSVHIQDINRAKNRVRKAGYAVPRKVQDKNLPPPSTSVETYKPSTSLASEKVSVFMPTHLRKRVGCVDFCHGGEIENNNDNCNTGKLHDHILSSNTLSDIPCMLSNNNIYIVNDPYSKRKHVVLNSSDIDDYSQDYGVGKGRYLFSNVRLEDAFTILNHNKKQVIFVKGDKLKKFTRLVYGVEYEFYYGDVSLIVKGDFDVVSIYFYNHGYAEGKYLFRYIETCSDTTGMQCLNDPTTVRLVRLENDQYRLAFNSVTELYQSQYGLGKGKYLIKNVPTDLAFAILNKDLDSKIFLTSNKEKLSRNVKGKNYLFSYGDVEIHVLEDFEYASLIMYHDIFIGGDNILKYTDVCSDIIPLVPEGQGEPVETTEAGLPDTIYSQTLFKAYTADKGEINIPLRSTSYKNIFTKYVVNPNGPKLPTWLSLNETTGEIKGSSTDNKDAFYATQFSVHAILKNNKYKEYKVYIALFNETITDQNQNGGGDLGGGDLGGDDFGDAPPPPEY